MKPFYVAGLCLLLLSAVAFAIRPAEGDARTPLVWVSDDAPTRRLTIELFERLHPDIDVRLDPDNSGMEKVIVQSLGGVGPDLFDCYTPNQLAAYVKSGVAGDVTDALRAAGVNLPSDAWPLVRDHFTLDGKVYGAPANAGADTLWFDKDALEQAHVPFPKALAGWDELIALAQALTTRDASGRVTRYGLSFDEGAWTDILRSFGGRTYSADGARCTLDAPEAIAAMRLLHDLMYKYGVMATPAEQAATAEQGGWGSYGMRSLVGHRAAMSIGGRWWLLTLRKAPELRLGVATLPVLPGGAVQGGGKATLMNAKTKHRDAARTFLTFMAGREYNDLINREADAMGGIARYATDESLNDPRYPGEDFHATMRDAMRDAAAPERSPYVDASAADRLIKVQLDLVRGDAKDVGEAMRTAARQVNAEIDRALRDDPALRAQRYRAQRDRAIGASR